MESFFKNKKLAAGISVLSNFTLILLKLFTGFISGSVSIISEAIHSASDFLASVIALFAVHKSDQPADSDHQFGHGKYEDAAGFIEGCLIILASLYIIYEACKKLSGNAEPIHDSNLGIIVMFISVITNIIVSTYLFKVAKTTDSIAIFSDAEHLRTDIYSSLTVFAGLIIIKYTGIHIVDPIMAIIVAIIIMQAGYKICKSTTNDLLDGSLPEQDIETIKSTIKECKEQGISEIKEIRTRKAGKDKDIVIILLVNGNMTVSFAHELCDKLEYEIEQKLGNTKITIHIEPYEANTVSCQKQHI